MLYENPAVLEHLKPHKPAISASSTTITNNVHYLVNNNLRFNFAIHMKNRMPLSSSAPLIHVEADDAYERYTEIPLEQHLLQMSDYEWFLHTSRLKEVYRRQKQFIRTLERRRSGQDSFMKIIENSSELEIHAPLSWNSDRVTPSIYYVANKSVPQPSTEKTNTVTTETIVQNTTREYTPPGINVENKTVINSIDINAVADKVVKTMSEKLNIERLKKGG